MNKEKDTAKSAKPVSLRENVEKTVSRSTADKEAIDISRTFEGTERNESDVTKCPFADDKESLRRCKKSRSTEKVPSQTIGFPAKLPPKFLTEITIKASFEVPEARSGLVVSQAMLVLHVKEHSVFSDKVAVCDFICSINDHEITSKAEFCELIRALKRSAKPFTMKVKRPIWNMKTDHLPKGYDVVYVTHTDQLSLSTSTCIVGDCIVEVSGTPVTSTAVCSSIILKSLKEKKYVVMTLERAVSQRALHFVRFVLLAEKTKQLDIRMADDTTRIGCSQAQRIQNVLVPPPTKSIYRGKNHKRQNKRITIRDITLLTLIETDPFNPLLMQAVPPKKMDSLIEKVRHSRELNASVKEVPSTNSVDRLKEVPREASTKSSRLGHLFSRKSSAK